MPLEKQRRGDLYTLIDHQAQQAQAECTTLTLHLCIDAEGGGLLYLAYLPFPLNGSGSSWAGS